MKKELIIPLRIQEGYVATGWLGFEYGSLKYEDFTKPDFEAAYLKLCREIEIKGKVNHIQCQTNFVILPFTIFQASNFAYILSLASFQKKKKYTFLYFSSSFTWPIYIA